MRKRQGAHLTCKNNLPCELETRPEGYFHHDDAMNRDDKTSVKKELWQADVTGKEGRI